VGANWTPIGAAPLIDNGSVANSGRIATVAADPGNANVVYVGTAGGGVWKTTNAGATNPDWTSLTDKLGLAPDVNKGSLTSGALAVAPSNPSIVYYGTGEANGALDSQYGRGIYKSTDAGATWNLVGGTTFDRTCITKIVVDPSDSSRVFVTTSNAADGVASVTPGVYRSTDGGS